MIIDRHAALLVVDVQNDFVDGGALAVAGGQNVIAPINVLSRRAFGAVVATQDWHTPEHCSFVAQGGPWPPHCVAGTQGAELCADLDIQPITHTIHKGVCALRDSYSGFLDNDRHTRTGLDSLLKELDIRRVFIAGLALEYCVAATAFDAARLGYEVFVVTTACRAIGEEHAGLFEKFKREGIRFGPLEL